VIYNYFCSVHRGIGRYTFEDSYLEADKIKFISKMSDGNYFAV
jgi:hypothetical protein